MAEDWSSWVKLVEMTEPIWAARTSEKAQTLEIFVKKNKKRNGGVLEKKGAVKNEVGGGVGGLVGFKTAPKKKTYRPPAAKQVSSPTFCMRDTFSFQTMGMG